MEKSQCSKCEGMFLAVSMTNDLCRSCLPQLDKTLTLRTPEAEQKHASKPSIIGILSALGWILFAMTGLSGLVLISQDDGVFGVSLIIAGVFQLCMFLGFSAIIDQLHQINMNTSSSDKDE